MHAKITQTHVWSFILKSHIHTSAFIDGTFVTCKVSCGLKINRNNNDEFFVHQIILYNNHNKKCFSSTSVYAHVSVIIWGNSSYASWSHEDLRIIIRRKIFTRQENNYTISMKYSHKKGNHKL